MSADQTPTQAPGLPGAHAGRTAVVTGGATGLGAEYAMRLAADGARILIADLNDASATVAAIRAQSGEAVAVVADISSQTDVSTVAEAVMDTYGGCDILVNNAGIYPNVPWAELTFADWRRVMSINLDSMFLTCKALTPGMQERGFGRVVNVSSNTFGLVIEGFVHYVASKGGIIGLTRALASELGVDGITVNAVLPGLTQTGETLETFAGTTFFEDMAKLQAIKRPGVPADLAGVVSFLASDAARWVTGQAIVADGGLLRH
jgi:NAD(P)-dependent dehydrogenase (short-subunit alcohol dehydrogenase family)